MPGLCCGLSTIPIPTKRLYTYWYTVPVVSQRLNGNKDYGLLGCNAVCFGSRVPNHNIPEDTFIFSIVSTPNPHLSGKLIQNISQNSLYLKLSEVVPE